MESILRYFTITRVFLSDNGIIDEEELTPIVLIDGMLDGWGRRY